MSDDKNPVPMFNYSDIIPKFNGTDKTYSSAKWSQDVEDNAEIFGWSAQQKLVLARRSLVGTAELWLKSEKAFKTYEELKVALVKEFPDSVNSKEMHEFMAARRKKNTETYYEYMLTMKELGKRAKFPDYVAIQYIIDGIQDFESNKAILYGASTYSALKEKISIYETMKNKCKKRHEDTTKQEPKAKSYPEKQTEKSNRRCYKCGDIDHVANACKKGVKCFRCNSYGHIGPDCKAPNISKNLEGKHQDGGGHCSRNSMCTMILPEDGVGFPEEKHGGDERGRHERMSELVSMSNTCQSGQCQKCQSEIVLNVNKNFSCNKSVKNIKINGLNVDSLIDSGSDLNLISSKLFFELNVTSHEKVRVILSGLGSASVCSLGKFSVNIEIDGYCFDVCFYIVPQEVMPYKIILGQPFLVNVTAVIDKGSVTVMPICSDVLLQCMLAAGVPEPVCYVSDQQIRDVAQTLVDNYQPKRIKEAPIEMKIILKDDIPVAQRPRRLSLAEQKEVEEQVSEWLRAGIVRPSFSEYASPLVLVKKKDGSTRVCVDYRLINNKMVKDEFPLPVIEDHIDKLSGAKVFSKLDLKDAFFHLKIEESSVKYTSFVTHHGQFEFLRAPFGLSICPKYFTRFITIIFRDLIAKGNILIFIDDAIIPANDYKEAIERLQETLEVASDYGLEINWKKSEVLTTKVEYLGHVVQDGEIKPSTEKTEAVVKFPEPKTVKQLKSFMGLASYFRKYIPYFAKIASPLTNLLKKDHNFTFEDEHRYAFNILKEKLGSSPVLKIFNSKRPTELHTDASCVAYAAVLMQRCEDSNLHPVHYMSRKTSDAERKYSSYELEALAIIEGVKKFRHYLYGIPFKIITDCQAFQMTLQKKDLSTRVARWALLLQEFDFQIEHRSGTRMRHVDALSRNPYIGVTNNSLHDQIKKAQEQDEGLKAVKEVLSEKPYLDYYLEGDLLYKGLERKLVVPKNMEMEVIKRVHSNGHFAKKKMTELINKDYYIKDLSKKLEDFIVTCIPCILGSRKEGKQEGFLHLLEKEDTPLHTIHIDHIGPMTETKKMYNHLLTMVDAFTKFVWIFPTKSTTSKETIEKLRIHQQQFGNPTRIISDRGTAYTSREFQEYCEEEGIKHAKITTGVPRGNGQVERIHRTIISVLTKLCIENPTQWYKHVSHVQRALNSTWQRSINCTPFELLIGTKMKIKEDIEIYDLLMQEGRDIFVQDREDSRRKAKEHILQIQEENIRTFNRKRKESTKYKEGNLVAIKRTQFGVGMKLKPKYLGPYVITKVKGNDRYDVQKADPTAEGPGMTSTVADFMKIWPND